MTEYSSSQTGSVYGYKNDASQFEDNVSNILDTMSISSPKPIPRVSSGEMNLSRMNGISPVVISKVPQQN